MYIYFSDKIFSNFIFIYELHWYIALHYKSNFIFYSYYLSHTYNTYTTHILHILRIYYIYYTYTTYTTYLTHILHISYTYLTLIVAIYFTSNHFSFNRCSASCQCSLQIIFKVLFYSKELSLCHKLEFSNPCITPPQCREP